GINGSVATFQNGESNLAMLIGVTLVNGSGTLHGWIFGGGIFCYYASPVLSYLIIRDNYAFEYGGGIACHYGSSPIIDHVTIENNEAGYFGGGIHCEGADSPVILNSVIRGNIADAGSGISVWSNSTSLVVENTLLCENTGSRCIYNEGGNSSYTLVNVTITNNENGALQLSQGGYATIVNSVLWGNPPNEIAISSPPGPNSVVITYSDISGGLEGIQGNLGDTVAWLDGNIDLDPLFRDAEASDYRLSVGSPCIDAGTYFFEWEGETIIDLSPDEYIGQAPDMGAFESGATTNIEADGSLPGRFVLQQNHPNPFNPQTTIHYELPKQTTVTLRIFDLAGRLVDVLVEGEVQPAGAHTATWNGRDLQGRAMPSGTYFYRLETGGYTETKRMTLIR
ncbi:MAG: hypothetical protein DRI46_13625, partial [Chloroflexi bacterium]